MQDLKAVAMGAIAAIAFFWLSVPNPAIGPMLLAITCE
jgi:hypothetical protein